MRLFDFDKETGIREDFAVVDAKIPATLSIIISVILTAPAQTGQVICITLPEYQ